MGMYDIIICEVPLPETEVPPPAGEAFQTKDTPDQGLTPYTITKDGQLTWRPYRLETVLKEDRPYPDASENDWRSILGSVRRVESGPIDVDFHGDILFYASNHPDVGWWEYRARFSEGQLLRIDLIEFRAPEGRDTNAEIAVESV